jgi:hypothetical protein
VALRLVGVRVDHRPEEELELTGGKPSSPSVAVPKASTSRLTKRNCGPPTPKMEPFPFSTSRVKKWWPRLSADVKGANRLKFTPDGKHVLVSTLAGPT